MIFKIIIIQSKFVWRVTELSSTWLLTRVIVLVFLLMVTDPTWDIADLILQTYKVGTTAAVQTGQGFFWVRNVRPSQIDMNRV